MAAIICDISALEYYRTPPQARDLQLSTDDTLAQHIPSNIARPRANSSDIVFTLHRNICGPLKGISFPVHIATTDNRRFRAPQVKWHDLRRLSPADVIPVSEGLYVTSPARTLFDLARNRTRGAIAKLFMEFLGLYTSVAQRPLISDALAQLGSNCSSEGSTTTFASYYDTKGRPIQFADELNETPPWICCDDNGGHANTLWKRAPLCTLDDLVEFAQRMGGAHGIDVFRQAIEMVTPGSGSPLESLVALLLGPSRRRGQEGLPKFCLNRQVSVPRDFTESLHSPVLVPDIGWFAENPRKLLGYCEADGADYHMPKDVRRRRFYNDSIRRAALAHICETTVTITYPQVADLQKWDMLLDLIYRMLGLESRKPTVAFLQKRDQLHRELMSPGI